MLAEIRDRLMQVQQSNNYSAEQTLTWRLHLDHQLYKALEAQWRFGLQRMYMEKQDSSNHDNQITEVAGESVGGGVEVMVVEIIFKHGKLQYRPPLEEIRARVYRNLKKFVTLPCAFKGTNLSLNSNPSKSSIYQKMIAPNVKHLTFAYSSAEKVFHGLAKCLDVFEEWTVVGSVHDLDQFVASCVVEVVAWEAAFNLLKAKGRDAEKIPQIIHLSATLHVSTTSLKATIDDHLQRLFDALVQSLRRSALSYIKTIDEFIERGVELLSMKPQSVEEMAAANTNHSLLMGQKIAVEADFDKASMRQRLLKRVIGGGDKRVADNDAAASVDLNALQMRWNKFELLLESHQLMIRDQVAVLKRAIDGRVVALQGDLEGFEARWQQLKPNPLDFSESKACDAFAFVVESAKEFEELKTRISTLIQDAQHFGVVQPEFATANRLEVQLIAERENWALMQEFELEFEKISQQDWLTFRTRVHQLEEFLGIWSEKAHARQQTTLPPTTPSPHLSSTSATSKSADAAGNMISLRIIKKIDACRSIQPTLKYLRGDDWLPEHWGEVFRIAQIKPFPPEVNGNGLVGKVVPLTPANLTLGHLVAASAALSTCVLALKELNARVQGELSIRQALQELDIWGTGAVFHLIPYGNDSGATLHLIKDWSELLSQVGDYQSLLQSIKDSAAAQYFADKIMLWEKRLVELDALLRDLNVVQRKYIYLQPIFSTALGSSGGGKSLPSDELLRFQRIDSEFRALMGAVARDGRVIQVLNYPNARDVLNQLMEQFERSQKALGAFMASKRDKFPRFFFIGDEDLLEILGQSRNPTIINNHLKKLFAGLHRVLLDASNKRIVAFCSAEGERVTLREPVMISDDVESWLFQLLSGMKETLRVMTQECVAHFHLLLHPQQVINTTEAILFTRNCEMILNGSEWATCQTQLARLKASLEQKLSDLTETNIQETLASADALNIGVDVGTQSLVLELKLKSMIMDVIRFIEVVDLLVDAKATSVHDWAWKRQVRFYLSADGWVLIRMCDAEFRYSYEYQGNVQRLVHTPLTDKCYMTLTQAMQNGYGGNLYGPAGTGKTESVKALGSLFGRQVLVFNCDEGLDYKSIARLFTGLVKCGAWGCFDEFNRLEEQVLSAVSLQIQSIQSALKSHSATVNLLGCEHDLNPDSAIFVTLNPAGKGYGGRQKLPDNLKQLFRAIAMTAVDNTMIAQVILLSEGFKGGRVLGGKAVTVFELCRQLLSTQQHYDWGLRPLKAILRCAGSLLQQSKRVAQTSSSSATVSSIDTKNEMEILVESLGVNTLSKLTLDDAQKFVTCWGGRLILHL